jgi:glycosyltransferase involved in cell wall biosynthesis
MKKILVICQNYPSPGNPFSQPFIHTRLLEYVKFFDVTVLSFAAKEQYSFEGVNVINEREFTKVYRNIKFDLAISHAPNIRNHYRFLFYNVFSFNRLMFVFHGYEVIDIHKRIYNQKTHYEFPYKHSGLVRLYHKSKLPLTCMLLNILSRIKVCGFVFVSNVLLREAKEDLKSNLFHENRNTFIVNNPINELFNTLGYEPEQKSDFICIRPFDDSKYGVDIFIALARNNPAYTFHLYGKGVLPKVQSLPQNLKVIDGFMTSSKLIKTLNNYRGVILPTRWDSQGVLGCEIAAYGMPIITSDLEVCREMLSRYPNVTLVSNEIFDSLDLTSAKLKAEKIDRKFYTHKETTYVEIDIARSLTDGNK